MVTGRITSNATSVASALIANTAAAGKAVNSRPASAGPTSAEELHTMALNDIALSRAESGTNEGVTAVPAGMAKERRVAAMAAAR